MWIKGRRRGGAKDLADHLRKTDENESVAIRDLEGFAFDGLTGKNLEKALRQMEAIGYGKGDKRNLFHTIISPAYGETLNDAQKKFMVEYYAEYMGLKGHQYALVEHWKKGKQHFHLAFNIIDPVTGKTHELKWTKNKEWRISRGLEEIFGLSTPTPRGKSSQTWETQRGNRTGTDPSAMRKEVTAIFHASKTSAEFVSKLDKAGYALTRGRRDQLVLVDRFGETHGLLRRIEGQKLNDLRQKFPGIEEMPLPSHVGLVKERKDAKSKKSEQKPINPQHIRDDVRRAYSASKTGAAFFVALNKKGYGLHRGVRGFSVIDANGTRHNLNRMLGKENVRTMKQKFGDYASVRPNAVSEAIRHVRASLRNSAKPVIGKRRPIATRRPFLSSGGGASRSASKAPRPTFIGTLHATPMVRPQRSPALTQPVRPPFKRNGWPEEAVLDWEGWGYKQPRRFFTKWPELAS